MAIGTHIGRGVKRALAALAMTAAAQAMAADAGLQDICGDCKPVLYAHCGGFLEGPNFDHDGKLWVVDFRGDAVLTVTPQGCQKIFSTGGGPNGSRFHKDGRLFITDARGLLIYDPRTKALTVRLDTVAGEKLVAANDLIFDKSGGLYFTVPGTSTELKPTGRVIYLPPEPNAEPRVFAEGVAFPNGIALSPDGSRVYIGRFADQSILWASSVSDPTARKYVNMFVRTVGGNGPDGMTVDATGRLFWANFFGGDIGVADPSGHPLGTIKLPPEAGLKVTNVVFHDGYLYITEADKGDVWRVPVKTTGATLFADSK